MFRRIISGGIISLLLTSIMILSNIIPVRTNPSTITVPDDYSTIQEAINHANEGDTIFVKNGTYYENIIVNKTLTLVGEISVATIVDGNQKEFVVSITCSNVKVEGFTFRNTSMFNSSGFGITVHNVTNCLIQRNTLHSNYCGIRLSSCINSKIINNNIKSNLIGITSEYSPNCMIINNNMPNNLYNGILIRNSDNCTICDNYVARDNYGIDIQYSNKCTIKNNTVQNTSYYGIQIYSSHGSEVDNNTVNENYHIGVSIQYSMNCTIAKNVIKNNKNGYGLEIYSSNNTHAVKNLMNGNYDGIQLLQSNDCEIYNNEIDESSNGIYIYSSDNNKISYNTLESNFYGFLILYSSSCSVTANNVKDSRHYGASITYSSENVLFHNNFVNNRIQAYITHSSNMWNKSVEGNFWSDYKGMDLYGGSYKNITGSDGIGDSEHAIDSNNIDHYPLMGTFSDFNVTSEQRVQTISNSAISDFQFNGTAIIFNVLGENGTTGFCRICIPKASMNGNYTVFVNGEKVNYTSLPCSNTTHSYLYFSYTLSTKKVIIVSEFLSLIILPLSMIATLLATIIHRRRKLV